MPEPETAFRQWWRDFLSTGQAFSAEKARIDPTRFREDVGGSEA
jgi:hypothetical protein